MRLTNQEQQVYDLAIQGLFLKEIAQKLYISVDSVGVVLHRIYKKAGVANRVELLIQIHRGGNANGHEQVSRNIT